MQGNTDTPSNLPSQDFAAGTLESSNPPSAETTLPGTPSQAASFGVPITTTSSGQNTGDTESGDSGKKSSNNLLLILILLLLLVAVVAGAYYYFFVMPNKADNQIPVIPTATPEAMDISYVATLTYTEGVVSKGTASGKTTTMDGDKLAQGDSVVTDAGAKAIITFDDGSLIRIGPETSVVLTQVDTAVVLATLDTGVLYAKVESGSGRIFTIAAGNTLVQSLGTAFSVEKIDEVAVNVFENKVKVMNAGQETQIAEKLAWKASLAKPVAVNNEEVAADNFLQWALTEELKRVEKEIIASITPPANKADKQAYIDSIKSLNLDKPQMLKDAFQKTSSGTVGSITLTATKTADNGLNLSWTADGLAGQGFRLVWSKTPAPTYPRRIQSDGQTFNEIYGYTYKIGPIKAGDSFYIRACENKGTTCSVYSNELHFDF